MMPPQRPPFATTDLRPSRSQIEALLSDVAREQGARQKLLDAFQAHGLLSGTEMLDEGIVELIKLYQGLRAERYGNG